MPEENHAFLLSPHVLRLPAVGSVGMVRGAALGVRRELGVSLCTSKIGHNNKKQQPATSQDLDTPRSQQTKPSAFQKKQANNQSQNCRHILKSKPGVISFADFQKTLGLLKLPLTKEATKRMAFFHPKKS